MKTKIDFEYYLKEIHAEDYHGTDDDMSDAFDAWLGDEVQIDDLIVYSNRYAAKMMLETKEIMLQGIAPMVELLEEIKEAVVPLTPHDLK